MHSRASKNGNGDGQVHRIARVDLAENAILAQLFGDLAARGFTVEDFFLVREEQITGEMDTAKFKLSHGEQEVEVDNLAAVASSIRDLGRAGVAIKRFKGLGEMNAEELWETTMDRSNRTLRRVTISDEPDNIEQFDIDSREADHTFSLLMGGDVEARRDFIETNAVNVKNLDI